MSERDFSTGGKNFKLNKIDAMAQFHIVRRLGPVLGDVFSVAQKLSKSKLDQMSPDEAFDAIAATDGVTKIMRGISSLSDEDSNKVLLGLCSSVEMQQPTGWARVATSAGLMFQDLELPTLLQLAGRAFVYNMSGFFASAPQASLGG